MKHTEDDKKMADHIILVEREITVAKAIGSGISMVVAAFAWAISWFK